jgi:hypothetical protein
MPTGTKVSDCVEIVVDGFILRIIPRYEEYAINCDGTKLWSSPRWRRCNTGGYTQKGYWFKLKPNRLGYSSALLRSSGRVTTFGVHVLVAMTWVSPSPFDGAWVLHRDDNPRNNHYTNLYWGTARDNKADCLRNGHVAHGERHPRARYSNEYVAFMKFLLETESPSSIMKMLRMPLDDRILYKIKYGTTHVRIQPSCIGGYDAEGYKNQQVR